MTTALDTRLEYLPLIPKKDYPPITVDWNATIRSLSTDLQGYDVSLELTITDKMYKKFFTGETAELKVQELLTRLEHLFAVYKAANYANGATVVAAILAGQTTLDKAADLVRGLGDRHQAKANYLNRGRTKISGERTILKRQFRITETRHSFSVGDIHQLARRL